VLRERGLGSSHQGDLGRLVSQVFVKGDGGNLEGALRGAFSGYVAGEATIQTYVYPPHCRDTYLEINLSDHAKVGGHPEPRNVGLIVVVGDYTDGGQMGPSLELEGGTYIIDIVCQHLAPGLELPDCVDGPVDEGVAIRRHDYVVGATVLGNRDIGLDVPEAYHPTFIL